MSLSFEKILDFSFFNSELLKWIGIQEIGRLKCTSKKIQSKLTIQNIRPLLEENLTFRSLIFRNQLDIIEQIIPFKFNKRKHKFPQQVLKALFNKAASEGKLNLINLLISEECRPIFGYIDFLPFTQLAAEKGHIEIAKMIWTKLEWLIEIGVINGAQPQAKGWKTILFNELSAIAFSRNDREFTKWLLKHSNSNSTEKLDLLEEIEKVTIELENNNINQTETERNEKQNWLQCLYYVSTTFVHLTTPEKTLRAILSDNWDKDTVTLSRLRWLGHHMMFLPDKVIQRFSEYWSPKEPKDDSDLFFWLAWYAFIDDFEKFKETATTLKMRGKNNWPVESPVVDSPLIIIILLTTEKNLPTKYFDLCLEYCNTIEQQNCSDKAQMEIEKCCRKIAQHKRLDLLEKLLKFSTQFTYQLFYALPRTIDIALSTADPKFLKCILEQFSQYVILKNLTCMNFTIQNLDLLKILFDYEISLTCRPNNVSFFVLFSDLEICKMMFRHKPWANAFNTRFNWVDLLDFCLEEGDEELLNVLFFLEKERSIGISRALDAKAFQALKSKEMIRNVDSLNELLSNHSTMNYSFEILMELSFFVPELLKWIGIQEMGRLKCTSKKIQSKFTLETIRPLLEENLTFRTLIFRNRLDIIEQIIPFKFNKRKHKFPQQVLNALFNKAASEGKLNLINLIHSEECIDVFAVQEGRPIREYLELNSVVASKALQNGHREIAKMVINSKVFENQDYLQNQLFAIAYSRNDREFTKWMLKQPDSSSPLATSDRKMLSEEIEKVTQELNSTEFNDKNQKQKEKQQWLDYLYYLTSLYTFVSNPYHSLLPLMKSDWEKDESNQFQLKYIGQIMKFVPEQVIRNYSDCWSEEKEKDENGDPSFFYWLAWYAFVDDFEKFKEIVATKTKNKPDWPLVSFHSDCVLCIVCQLISENKLPLKYFDFCLDACQEIDVSKSQVTIRQEIKKCLKATIQSKNLNLVDRLLKYSAKKKFFSDSSFEKHPLAMAVATEDPKVVDFVIKQLNLYFNLKEKIFPNLVITNTDVLKVIVDAEISFAGLAKPLVHHLFSNLDLCKMMLRYPSFSKTFDIEQNWFDLIQMCIRKGDEDLLKLLFSLTSEFPTNLRLETFSKVSKEVMKSTAMPPNGVVIDVFNSELKKLIENSKLKAQ